MVYHYKNGRSDYELIHHILQIRSYRVYLAYQNEPWHE